MAKNFPLLDQIHFPEDLRKLPISTLDQVAVELRESLIDSLNVSGGHFAASLGCIELAIALHYVFDTPTDRLIWDTGHQAYAHKMLTGRRHLLQTIRQYGGLAPFPKRGESDFDPFGVGHCSTSISAAMGMAIANQLSGAKRQVIAIIGDGGLTAGIAFEALNHLNECQTNVLIVLNDNQISISPTIGGLARQAKVFEEMGLDYRWLIDGHDIPTLIEQLRTFKEIKGPRLLHITTQKGKGYLPAELDPFKYHAVSAGFNDSSQIKKAVEFPSVRKNKLKYSQVFGEWICQMAAKDLRLVAITPAMEEGSGLGAFSKQYPDRYFDVGIAEQHSVTLAAGLAAEGYKPVVAIYSTFLQRAYDQLIHDVALQKLPVLFAIDRAGIVGFDGSTHGGFFDLSYLRAIPNMVVMAPADQNECRAMLTFGFLQPEPVAIRYPRGFCPEMPVCDLSAQIQIGQASVLRTGKKVALLAFGSMVLPSLQAAEAIDATLINMRFIKPLDQKMIDWAFKNHDLLVTIEENVIQGGAGSAVNEYLMERHFSAKVLNLGLPNTFIEHGTPEFLLSRHGLDTKGILLAIEHKLKLFAEKKLFSLDKEQSLQLV